jgi:hypothetical protein
MNSRERTLMFALIAIVGTGVALFAGNKFWWAPLQEYNRTIDRLSDERDTEDGKVRNFMRDKKQLALGRMRSLPGTPDQAAAEFMSQLEPLLKKSGLDVDSIQKSSVAKAKVVTPIPSVKETGHQIVTFTVNVRGELAQLVKALEKMQSAPYEHRIRDITIERENVSTKKGTTDKLNVRMIVEALLVAKAPVKGTTPPSSFDPKTLIPQSPTERNYSLIAKKNIFVGAIPYVEKKSPPKTIPVEPVEEGPERPPEYTPQYVYLTQTLPEQRTAYIFNRVYGGTEKKLIAEKTGWDEFQISDELGEYVFFRAKLLKVEQREIYFQIGRSNDDRFPTNSVFSMQIGHSLALARDFSFNKSRIDLEDDGLFDREFSVRETPHKKDAKDAKDNKGKTSKKGRMGG